jgi:hypothetical protein
MEQLTESHDAHSPRSFLSSHRAQAVCTREFARLCDEVVSAAKALARDLNEEMPVVRRMPDRCIVQLGPVALTVTWLKNGSESPGEGQLLAIVWRGVIAPRGEHLPERLGARRVPPTPQSAWEEAFVVSAVSEATWHWHPETLKREGYESSEVAARCTERLRDEHALLAVPVEEPPQ